jgi:hypothetical protein
MTIRKQEFYEGAALHILARTGQVAGIRYDPPFFFFNDRFRVLVKYSTKGRSPWGFTFTADEQTLLRKRSSGFDTSVALICGADGVAAFSYELYATVAAYRESAIHISCYRQHGEHYEINGPDGTLSRKVPPSNWQRLLGK